MSEKFEFDWQWFEIELNNSIEEARALYNDFEKNGLSFSKVEAEGYLRAMLTIKSEFDRIKEISSKEF